MPTSQLPDRVSLEFLKKRAKDRLQDLREIDPKTNLATALLTVARDYGFSSWRALKLEVERRLANTTVRFFEACANGDLESLRNFLDNEPGLIRSSDPDARHNGWTGLHSAARRGNIGPVQLLLERGADPNAREAGDNTYPLHWAAAGGHAETARALLDAGGDAHGEGDLHELEVVGLATFYYPHDRTPVGNAEILKLLLESGVQHHIFSAIAVGDLRLIQEVVELNPEFLDRRLSRFDDGLTALHYAISRKRYDILDLLIELGADLDAVDQHGHTALAAAMLCGDQMAMLRLRSAGAMQPKTVEVSNFQADMAALASTVRHGAPMIPVPDVARTLAWYKSIGFKEVSRNEDDGQVNWGLLSFGKADLMLTLDGKQQPHGLSLWFYTDQVDKLYHLLRSRQLAVTQSVLAEERSHHAGIEFVDHIYNPFYGGREFGIRDLNGYLLNFRQPPEW